MELNVSDNNLKMLPPTMGYLKQLTTLLADNNALDFLPPEVTHQVAGCRHLRLLLSCFSGVSCIILCVSYVLSPPLPSPPCTPCPFSMSTKMGSCGNLSILSVHGNHIGVLPHEFCHLSKLTVLNITGNRQDNAKDTVQMLKPVQQTYVLFRKCAPNVPQMFPR